MNTNRTNLLPLKRVHLLTQIYFVRLGVVSLVVVTLLAAVAAVMRVPEYVLQSSNVSPYQARVASLDAQLSSSDDQTLQSRISAFSNNLMSLKALSTVPPASALVREVLAKPHVGVTISSVHYIRAVGTKPSAITISGTATTREALSSYQVTLQSVTNARSVDLPVSSYAKNSDIPFSITVTLTL